VYEYTKLANERGTKSFLKGGCTLPETPCIRPRQACTLRMWHMTFVLVVSHTEIEKRTEVDVLKYGLFCTAVNIDLNWF
jgi:hypothetical protein